MESQNNTQQTIMPGYMLQLKAKKGKGGELAMALRNTITNIQKEKGTLAWFGFRINETDFGIFDAFLDQEARQIHKDEGMERVKKLFPLIEEGSLVIKEVDIISYKFDRG